MDRIVSEKREKILAIAAMHGAGNIRVFGSMARGDARDESDVDLLVQITGRPSPWFPGGLIADLEQLLGRSIDVALESELHPRIRNQVLREAVAL